MVVCCLYILLQFEFIIKDVGLVVGLSSVLAGLLLASSRLVVDIVESYLPYLLLKGMKPGVLYIQC